MILRIRSFWLNVGFVVVLLGERVGVETRCTELCRSGRFAFINVQFFNRVAGNGEKCGQVLGRLKVLVCWYRFQDA